MSKKTTTYPDKPKAISKSSNPQDTTTVVVSDRVMVFEDIDNWKAVRVLDDGLDEKGNKRPPKSCWIYDDKDKYVAYINYDGGIDFIEHIGNKFVAKPTEQLFNPSSVEDLKQAMRYIYIMLQQPSI